MNTQDNSIAVVENAESAKAGQYLTFKSNGDIFAIGILRIKEIIEYGQLTPVPMMPGFVRGVINLRGQVLPVIDLSVRFSAGMTEQTKRTCIIVVEIDTGEGRQDIGVMVDAVSEVIAIADNMIEPPPTFGAKIRSDFISGMGKVDEGFVIILEVDNVLSVDEMVRLSA